MSDLKGINRVRQDLGLPLIVRKNVPCLLCKKNFESKDYPRQRLCFICRSRTDEFSSYEQMFYEPSQGEPM